MKARLRALLRGPGEVLLYGVSIGLAVALAWLVVGRAPVGSFQAPRATRPVDDPRPSAAPSPSGSIDPASIRDVFRFAQDGTPAPTREPEPEPLARADEALPGGSSLRLVGLVSRAGRLAAALAAEGEVVLAFPGEQAAGVTVLAIGDDGVRVRHSDGREELLPLP
jgi:hypothetical protein